GDDDGLEVGEVDADHVRDPEVDPHDHHVERHAAHHLHEEERRDAEHRDAGLAKDRGTEADQAREAEPGHRDPDIYPRALYEEPPVVGDDGPVEMVVEKDHRVSAGRLGGREMSPRPPESGWPRSDFDELRLTAGPDAVCGQVVLLEPRASHLVHEATMRWCVAL